MFEPAYDTLEDYLRREVGELYDAEHRLRDLWPRLGEAATDVRLTRTFDRGYHGCGERIERLEIVFGLLGIDAERHLSKGMVGLVKEGEEQIKADGNPMVRDIALAAVARRLLHYAMAGYGVAGTVARAGGQPEAAGPLQACLEGLQAGDRDLTQVTMQLYRQAA